MPMLRQTNVAPEVADDETSPARRLTRVGWLAVIAAFALTLVAFWPGMSSPDSITLLAQTRGAEPLTSVHPPLYALIWRATDPFVPGGGGMFALVGLVFFVALGASVGQVLCTAPAQCIAIGIVGLWPASVLMLGHIWKDAAMSAAMLAGVAMALHALHAVERRRLAICAIAAVGAWSAAVALRHNAASAALPLLFALLWNLPGVSRAAKVGLLSIGTVFVLSTPGWIERASGTIPRQSWPAVALWDLAAVSVRTGSMRMPPSLIDPTLRVEDLKPAYVPYANPPLFATNRVKLSFWVDYTEAESHELRHAWWSAVRDEPRAFLAHRWAASKPLLLGYTRDLPVALLSAGFPQIEGDRPPPGSSAERKFVRLFALTERAFTTPVFSGGLYLVLAALAPWLAPARSRAALFALATSAWLYALPYFLITGSSEFRYLHWSVVAGLAAFAIALLQRWEDRDTPLSGQTPE